MDDLVWHCVVRFNSSNYSVWIALFKSKHIKIAFIGDLIICGKRSGKPADLNTVWTTVWKANNLSTENAKLTTALHLNKY